MRRQSCIRPDDADDTINRCEHSDVLLAVKRNTIICTPTNNISTIETWLQVQHESLSFTCRTHFCAPHTVISVLGYCAFLLACQHHLCATPHIVYNCKFRIRVYFFFFAIEKVSKQQSVMCACVCVQHTQPLDMSTAAHALWHRQPNRNSVHAMLKLPCVNRPTSGKYALFALSFRSLFLHTNNNTLTTCTVQNADAK